MGKSGVVILIVILLCCLSGGTLAASSPEVIPLDSTVYQEMDMLYLLSGLGSPSTSRPWTKAEAAVIGSEAGNTSIAVLGRWRGQGAAGVLYGEAKRITRVRLYTAARRETEAKLKFR